MKKHLTLKPTIVPNRTEMEALMRDIASLKLEEKTLTAQMDAEIQRARDNYESHLGAISESLAQKVEVARVWAEANPQEFTKRKSVEFTHGMVGFRTGTPKLQTIARWKWDGVLAALRTLPWGTAYIRIKEEINKEQIIADMGTGTLGAADLRKAGARVVREESFYVEPKVTSVPTREVAEAA